MPIEKLYFLIDKLILFMEEDLSKKNQKMVIDSLHKLTNVLVQLHKIQLSKKVNVEFKEDDQKIIDRFLDKKKVNDI